MDDTVDKAIADVAATSYGLFGRHHLDLLMVSEETSRHRLTTGRWEAVHDGVYRIAGSPPSWRGTVLAACWAGGTRACASHRSAAALLGLPGGRRDIVEISCPRWRRARHAGLVVHESLALGDDDIAFVSAIPTTNIERTLFDLAGSGRRKSLELALDSALRRDLTTIAALEQTSVRLAKRGRRGTALFRAVVQERDEQNPIPGSEPERLLALALVDQGLPTPRLQYEIRDHDGSFVARVDLAYPEWNVVIEYDSYQEHTGRLALVRDSARRNAIIALGYHALTATAADLRDQATALARSVRRIRERVA